jgi:hypothetical protein
MRLKELYVELRDRIVSRHRNGEEYQNISAALKVPKNTVASIILKWKKMGEPSLQHSTNQAFMVVARYESHSSVKGTTAHFKFAKRHLKDSQNMRNPEYLV